MYQGGKEDWGKIKKSDPHYSETIWTSECRSLAFMVCVFMDIVQLQVIYWCNATGCDIVQKVFISAKLTAQNI